MGTWKLGMDAGALWSGTGGLGTPEVWSGTVPMICVTGDRGICCCHPALSPAPPADFGVLRKALTWLLVPARLCPRGCGSTAGFWGGFWGRLAGRQLCLAVPCAPRPGMCSGIPFQASQPKIPPGEGGPGLSVELPGCPGWCQPRARLCSCHSSEVFGVFCAFLLQSQ